MKYITKYKSPNYNSRKNSKISLIIIHYTALKNTKDAITYLCNKKNKVSSHYFISQNGSVYCLVQDEFRAWHAGQAFWQEITDINSISIGIELDYNPSAKNNKFSFELSSVIKLSGFNLYSLLSVKDKAFSFNLTFLYLLLVNLLMFHD